MKRVAVVFGTRPEAIKLAPVCRALAERGAGRIEPLIWTTGQHRQMLDQVMSVFSIRAARDFEIMTPGQTISGVTAAVLTSLEKAFAEDRPDLVVVQGDTTTAFATSLAAFYARIPVAHVEAGLRTADRFIPYPEEMNRRLTTNLSDFHFAPTNWSRDNLLRDGVPVDRIWVTGNTVIDALDLVVRQVRATPPPVPVALRDAVESKDRMVLITGHRRESFGAGFESICHAIRDLAARYPQVRFVYPVHLNPNVQAPVRELLASIANVSLIEPLDYRSFVWAMDRSFFLLSDSGGIQEEAPHLGKPVLVMRDATERPEAIDAGTSKLVGTDRKRIVRECARLLDDPAAYEAMSRAHNPFGDGRASERIVDVCLGKLG